MEKNFGHVTVPVEVDPVSGEPIITIPDWMILDLGWEEGDELEWIIDEEDNCLILRKP
jgi:bifunctional DNA-binding transcriptional regulator/antitoxin component of YhaV-PrlF toxin-antitoxin module